MRLSTVAAQRSYDYSVNEATVTYQTQKDASKSQLRTFIKSYLIGLSWSRQTSTYSYFLSTQST